MLFPKFFSSFSVDFLFSLFFHFFFLGEDFSTSDQQNNDASRTLLRVKQKLEGSENGQAVDVNNKPKEKIENEKRN